MPTDHTLSLDTALRSRIATVWFIAMAGYAAGLGIAIAITAISNESTFYFMSWKITQYFANYFDHGLIRRGLIGTVFFPFTRAEDAQSPALNLLVVGISTACAAAFMAVVAKALSRLSLSAAAAFTLGPLGAVQLGFDVGRFDLLLYCFLFAQVRFMDSPIASTLIAVAATLTHEAYLFVGLPIIAALARPYWYGPVLAALAVAALLVLFGNTVDGETIGKGVDAWNRGYAMLPFRGAKVSHILATFAVLAIIYGWWLAFYWRNGRRFDPLFFAAFAPLCLFFLGRDHARWLSVVFIVVAVCACLKVDRGFAFKPTWPLWLLALPIGPAGVTVLLPVARLLN